jgi:integrase
MGKQKRVRVERGLYQTGKVYEACATPPGSRNARWKSLGKIGLMEARDERDKFAVEVRSSGRAVLLDRTSPLTPTATVAEVADEALRVVTELVALDKLSKRTEDSYRNGVNHHVKPFFQGRRATAVTPDDLVDWVDFQEESGAAAWSIRARWTALRLVFAHAARHRVIAASPADVLKPHERPGPGMSRLRFLNDSEIKLLFKHATSLRTRVALALLLFCGLRAAEALGVIFDEVDFDGSNILVRFQMSREGGKRVRIKTDRSSTRGTRDVATMAAQMKLLREWRRATKWSAGTDLVLTNSVGNTMGYWDLRDEVAAVFKAAGISGATPHALRHTFASILIDKGRSLEFVADQMGISPQTAQRIYIHLFRAREHAAASREALEGSYGSLLRGS